MNALEARYALHLGLLKASGEILDFRYEPISLRLAHRTFYIPDFMVVNKDLGLEIHDVKGTSKGNPWYEDDAIVKIKTCAEHFPFLFKIVWFHENTWKSREY